MKRTSALLGSITLGMALTLGLVLGLLAISVEEASADDGVWAQATKQQIAVDAALSWLRTQQADDGSFGSSEGTTVDVVLTLAAANEDPNDWKKNGNSPLDYLETRVITYATTPASVGKLALGVIAANQDPYDFGGQNLIAKLHSWYHPATGQFSSTTTIAPTMDQIYSLMALAVSFEPITPTARNRLAEIQLSSGAWCFDKSSPWCADENDTTAQAMQALIAAGEPTTSTAIVSATEYLSGTQISSGSGAGAWPSPWGSPADPSTSDTSPVIQALIAKEESPTSITWTRQTTTAFAALLALQSPAGGFPGFSGPNDLMATARAIPAMMGKPDPRQGRVMAARKALEYIRARQDIDGSWDTGFGTSPSAACDGIFAIVAYGDDPNTWKQTGSVTSPVDYLGNYTSTYPSSSAGAAGRMILAVIAAGGDPESFGGANLHTELQDHYNSSTGLYDTAPGNQAWAILALNAMGKPIPPLAVNALKGMVESTGAWSHWEDRSYGISMALMALRAAGEPVGSFYFGEACDHMRNTLQHNDGGFRQRIPPYTPYGQTDESDTNSTAFDIMGLVAGGENPQGWKWTKQLTSTDEITVTVNTPMYWLLGMQNSSKAFGYKDNPTDRADNLYATLQVVPALMHKYFPLEPVALPAPGAGPIYLPLVVKESSP
jgi:hypothetical protein